MIKKLLMTASMIISAGAMHASFAAGCVNSATVDDGDTSPAICANGVLRVNFTDDPGKGWAYVDANTNDVKDGEKVVVEIARLSPGIIFNGKRRVEVPIQHGAALIDFGGKLTTGAQDIRFVEIKNLSTFAVSFKPSLQYKI